MIVSGDVGGTKTLLGVFESAAPRPRLVAMHEFATTEYGSFVEILDKFEHAAQTRAIDALVIGLPVRSSTTLRG
jgi:glucokinase